MSSDGVVIALSGIALFQHLKLASLRKRVAALEARFEVVQEESK